MSNTVKEVVIVGGGTAGWITAGTLAAGLLKKGLPTQAVSITLIESADIAPVGVGEGTWPTMRNTLANMGISETEFLRHSQACFKQGSTFKGWVNGTATDVYQHPFSLPQDFLASNMLEYWQQDPSRSFAHLVSPQAGGCEQGLAPKQTGTPEYAAVCNYGYHLDAGKFSEFLKQHCKTKLQVRHIVDTVVSVENHLNGDIKHIISRDHGPIPGQLFIDCSGMKSLLLGQHYGVPFMSKHHQLFNDTALAAHINYDTDDSAIASTTISQAQTAGWIWDIGLPSRRGVGHVYSSQHQSEQQASDDLSRYITNTSKLKQTPSFKKITFTPGHRQQFWKNNCVAVGLSAGFVEPLEASSLALVELSAHMIIEQFPRDVRAIPLLAKRFNQRFLYRWQRTIDFLKLHYLLSQRQDDAYWLDNRTNESVPESLQEMLELWQYQAPWHYDFERIEVFPAASYQYILAGMGYSHNPNIAPLAPKLQQRLQHNIQQVKHLSEQYLSGLPTNRQLIDSILKHGLPTAQS